MGEAGAGAGETKKGRPARAFIGVGSNIRPEQNVLAALDSLQGTPGIRVVQISTFFRTPPLSPPGHSKDGDTENPDFLNGVLEVETELEPWALLEVLAGIEAKLGRVRTVDRYAPRPMDLDLLLFLPSHDSGPVGSPGSSRTTDPHPEVRTRAFVAIPLLELAPDLALPPDDTPLREVASAFSGPGGRPEKLLTARLRERLGSR